MWTGFDCFIEKKLREITFFKSKVFVPLYIYLTALDPFLSF